MVKCWNGLSREVVALFKARRDGALEQSALVEGLVPTPMAGQLEIDDLSGPAKPFCDSVICYNGAKTTEPSSLAIFRKSICTQAQPPISFPSVSQWDSNTTLSGRITVCHSVSSSTLMDSTRFSAKKKSWERKQTRRILSLCRKTSWDFSFSS